MAGTVFTISKPLVCGDDSDGPVTPQTDPLESALPFSSMSISLGTPVVFTRYVDLSLLVIGAVSESDLPTIPTPAPPTVTVVSPALGSELQADTALVIDVTVPAGSALLAVQIDVKFPGAGNASETAFSGTTFTTAGIGAGYANGSAVVAINGGYRFTIVRNDGWISGGVTASIRAFDKSGQVT